MRPPLAEIANNPLGIIASNNKEMGGRIRSTCDDPEILSGHRLVHCACLLLTQSGHGPSQCALRGNAAVRKE